MALKKKSTKSKPTAAKRSPAKKKPAKVQAAAGPGPGEAAPEFSLPGSDGRSHSLADHRGHPVVLYFYPKDDTPGCTKQACRIRDAYDAFRDAGAVVLGVSPDDESSHVKFKNKFQLPFTLLADTDHDAAEEYGVWKERSLYGKTFMGIERSTFVIDR